MSSKHSIPNIERYLAYSKQVKLPAKARVFSKGDDSDSLFYVISGTLSVLAEDHSGREMIIAYLTEGDFFGELGIYDASESIRSAAVVVRTKCELGEMSYKRFLELARIYPSVMQALDSQVAARLKTTTQRVLDLASLTAPARIANCLLDLCKLPDAEQLEDGVKIKISRQDVARIVGCSRELAGKILQDMVDAGTIYSKGMTFIIFGAKK